MAIFDSVGGKPGPFESMPHAGGRRRGRPADSPAKVLEGAVGFPDLEIDVHAADPGGHYGSGIGVDCVWLRMDIMAHKENVSILKDELRDCVVRHATLPPEDPNYCSTTELLNIKKTIEDEEDAQEDASNVYNKECLKFV